MLKGYIVNTELITHLCVTKKNNGLYLLNINKNEITYHITNWFNTTY